jgi:hypothetical protein
MSTLLGLRSAVLAFVVVVLQCSPAFAQSRDSKPVTIHLMVAAEGPQGLWMQEGKDLSSAEIKQLEAFITTDIQKLGRYRVVFSANEKDGVYLSIVAVKIGSPDQTWIVVSSELSVGDRDVKNDLITHDVIAGKSLEKVAASVVGYLTSAQLRAVLDAH